MSQIFASEVLIGETVKLDCGCGAFCVAKDDRGVRFEVRSASKGCHRPLAYESHREGDRESFLLDDRVTRWRISRDRSG
jgi:hypothetical protein